MEVKEAVVCKLTFLSSFSFDRLLVGIRTNKKDAPNWMHLSIGSLYLIKLFQECMDPKQKQAACQSIQISFFQALDIFKIEVGKGYVFSPFMYEYIGLYKLFPLYAKMKSAQ
jgi:hypothetical protein